MGLSHSTDGGEEVALTEFLKAFQSAYRSRFCGTQPDLVEFKSPKACRTFIPPFPNGGYKFLIQEQYNHIWNLCEERFLRGTSRETAHQSVIVGTSGIGKSAARLLYAVKWLEKETEAMTHFESVIFNVCNTFYVIKKNGVVKCSGSTPSNTSMALMLLDPCEYLSGAQTVSCQMLLVFTSPSPLAGENSKSFSGLDKSSRYYVMNAPTVEEMLKIYGAVDEKRLENFSWTKDGKRFCSLRWFGYDDDEIEQKLVGCLITSSREALWEWFVTNTAPVSNDGRLPFRLCVVEADSRSLWTVTRFMSPGIERFLQEWAMGTGRRKTHELASILQNRILRNGLGIFFEKWLFDALGSGLRLTIPHTSKHPLSFVFKETRVIHETKLEKEPSIIYKLDRATFPSIEGYAIAGSMLLLLQSTVSETHSGARFREVESIICTAGTGLQVLVVYIAPSEKNFVLPLLTGFPRNARAVRGTVDDTEFVSVGRLASTSGAGHGGALTHVGADGGASAVSQAGGSRLASPGETPGSKRQKT